ncbi:unnamed protein product [Rhodiola kirilowii]
MKAGYLDQGER